MFKFLNILIYVTCLVDSVIKSLDMLIGKAMGAFVCVMCVCACVYECVMCVWVPVHSAHSPDHGREGYWV